MSSVVFIGRNTYSLDWSEERDSGGMFTDTVGVYIDGGKYHAFVKWWGGGVAGPSFDSPSAARADAERLFNKVYGY